MQPIERISVWNTICAAGNFSGRFLCGAEAVINFSDLIRGTSLQGRAEELRGRSVLIRTRDQLASALAIIGLDGLARRIVICPPDLQTEDLRFIAASTRADAIVSDLPDSSELSGFRTVIPCGTQIIPANCDRSAVQATEWILLTSGTTGAPKMVVHTLETLGGTIESDVSLVRRPVWCTFYDMRRYGGLSIFLRAMLGGDSMVLSSIGEPAASFLARAGAHGVTHMTGTPSHWRRAIMSPAAHMVSPPYVRMSGEVADQSILDRVRSFYRANVSHAFASTEAGVGFVVNDGLAGFPSAWTGTRHIEVDLKVEDGTLRLRSRRNAICYIGGQSESIRGPDGYVDTGDMVELRGERYYFVGRRDGTINIGGFKVHPEEVEDVIHQHPQVRMALVRARKNALTGALVTADVVLEREPNSADDRSAVQHEILRLCRDLLAPHKVPVAINIVPELPVAATGKIARRCA
jgi:acyl-coenzyme A synthetase/AMP-(fatty) acid ligase